MKPYYEHGGITIYHGDCREILPALSADVLVTDPPYGINYVTQSRERVHGDDVPFDPSHLSRFFGAAVVFGANHFADKLPAKPGWIVWDKRRPEDRGRTQGDAELAWTTIFGATRIVRFVWSGGGSFRKENGTEAPWHTTQKPIGLMAAILTMKGVPPGSVVDPYMGSGTTLIAAKQVGRLAIGVELEERYCEIAAKRLAQEVLFANVNADLQASKRTVGGGT